MSPKGAATFFYSLNKKKFVIKVPRDPKFNDFVVKEGENLINLQTDLNNKSSILKSIPQFVRSTYFGSSQAMIISGIEGQLMARWINKKNYQNGLTKAANWLAEFHTLTKRSSSFQINSDTIDLIFGKVPDLSWYENFDGPRIRALKERYEFLQNSIKQQLLKIDDLRIPLSMVHGDFNLNNILITNNNICGVIDWGESNQQALPFEDLFHFPLSMFLSSKFKISTAKTLNSIELWEQVCSYYQEIQNYIIHYSNQTGIDPNLPYAFVPWYFFITAKKELLQWRYNLRSYDHYIRLVEVTLDRPLKKNI